MPRLYQTTPRATFAVLAAAAAAFSLMQSLVTPVLPTIQHDLHTSTGTVTWVLTAWLLAASVATPLVGRIADMIGKDRALLVALAAIAAGCLVAALAPNIGVLLRPALPTSSRLPHRHRTGSTLETVPSETPAAAATSFTDGVLPFKIDRTRSASVAPAAAAASAPLIRCRRNRCTACPSRSS